MGTVKILLPSFMIMIILLFSCSPKTASQLSKSEQRQWEQQKKEMSAEQFKTVVEGYETVKKENNTLERKAKELQESGEKKDKEIQRLSASLIQAQSQVDALKNDEQSGKRKVSDPEWEKGVVFRVQLGAFDDYDLRNMTQQGSDLEIIDEDGYIKYILGQFRDYDNANLFKKKLRKIGVKEAWIVPYKDGKRVALKEVLDQVID
ncbi:hypothetical protein [Negadavirga shengliensis]|uniref:SPOR domain-containing protein n=1 Tax=Negadavirga shengliensis TaxID=1389218 RepID=A0ABV9SXX1_9BACT